MKTNDEIINQAINELKGNVNIGDVVAHKSHKLARTLIDIVGNMGVCELPDGTIHNFPICELFDVNKVKNRAVELSIDNAFIPNRNN